MPKFTHKKKSQWEFFDSEFLSTPSRKSGVEFQDEADARLKACLFIEKIGKVLKMPIDQVNMGKVLLQRFYMRASTKEFHYRSIGASIIFIAGKLGAGEHFIKIENLIPLVARESLKRDDVDTKEGSKEFTKWLKVIFHYELIVLERLCFDDFVILPHTRAIEQIKKYDGSDKLLHCVFLYCNDALNTTLSVRYSPEMIADAALYSALKACEETLALDERNWLSELEKTPGQINFIKALSIEICLACDPSQYYRYSKTFGEKLYTKLAKNKNSPYGVLNASLCESSPMSNASPMLNTSGQVENALKSSRFAKPL